MLSRKEVQQVLHSAEDTRKALRWLAGLEIKVTQEQHMPMPVLLEDGTVDHGDPEYVRFTASGDADVKVHNHKQFLPAFPGTAFIYAEGLYVHENTILCQL